MIRFSLRTLLILVLLICCAIAADRQFSYAKVDVSFFPGGHDTIGYIVHFEMTGDSISTPYTAYGWKQYGHDPLIGFDVQPGNVRNLNGHEVTIQYRCRSVLWVSATNPVDLLRNETQHFSSYPYEFRDGLRTLHDSKTDEVYNMEIPLDIDIFDTE